MIDGTEIQLEELLHKLDASSWTARAKACEQVANLYCVGALGLEHRMHAEESFRALSADSEALIRRLLAECLKTAPFLPRDIALTLANDRPDIAAPFIMASPVLTDDDLVAIIRERSDSHQAAVARRPDLSRRVLDALAETAAGKAGAPETRRAG